MSFFTAKCLRASKSILFTSALAATFVTSSASALDFDWHGQFRAETNWLFGYSNGNNATTTPTGANGYLVPSNGDSPVSYQNLFLRLSPRVIVNDNLSLHSDLWLGTPDRGIFGGDQLSQSNSFYYTSNTGNASVTANTLYAEVATDFGTITVGRAPLAWGLGLIWNNNQDMFDRMPSTGDAIRLETKLGAFRFIPGVVKYRNGSNYGGTTLANGSTVGGGSGASDYTAGLTYINDDEQLDLGILFMRRIAGMNAGVTNPFSVDATVGTTGYAYNVWDFYVKKRAGIFTLSAEVPLVSGRVGGQDFSTVAGAAKVNAQLNDNWSVNINVGSADGQDNAAAGTSPAKLSAFYFHPDYRPALIMFNYNLRNFSGTASPYDNPITNARFLALGLNYGSGKWSHGVQGLYAVADKTANGVAGSRYFNTWDRHYYTQAAGATSQDKNLGFEVDYSLGYQWDEAFRLGLSTGLYFPGKFYEFSNSAVKNTTQTVFATNVNLMVKF